MRTKDSEVLLWHMLAGAMLGNQEFCKFIFDKIDPGDCPDKMLVPVLEHIKDQNPKELRHYIENNFSIQVEDKEPTILAIRDHIESRVNRRKYVKAAERLVRVARLNPTDFQGEIKELSKTMER